MFQAPYGNIGTNSGVDVTPQPRLREPILQIFHGALLSREEERTQRLGREVVSWKRSKICVTTNAITFHEHSRNTLDMRYKWDQDFIEDYSNIDGLCVAAILYDAQSVVTIVDEQEAKDILYRANVDTELEVQDSNNFFRSVYYNSKRQQAESSGVELREDLFKPLLAVIGLPSMKSSKQMILLEATEDAYRLKRSIGLGQLYQKYVQQCNTLNLRPSERVMEWIDQCAKEKFSILDLPIRDEQRFSESDDINLFFKLNKFFQGIRFTGELHNDASLTYITNVLTLMTNDLIFILHFDSIALGLARIDLNLFDSAIRKANTLLKLTLEDNALTDSFLGQAARLVSQQKHLQSLSLAHNLIQCQDAAAFERLLTAINESYTGLYLDLSNNPVCDQAVEPIERQVFFYPESPGNVWDQQSQSNLYPLPDGNLVRLTHLAGIDLSRCAFSKYFQWRLFCGYIEYQQRYDTWFQLRIFPLPFHYELLSRGCELFRRMSIKVDSDEKIISVARRLIERRLWKVENQQLQESSNKQPIQEVVLNAESEDQHAPNQNLEGNPATNQAQSGVMNQRQSFGQQQQLLRRTTFAEGGIPASVNQSMPQEQTPFSITSQPAGYIVLEDGEDILEGTLPQEALFQSRSELTVTLERIRYTRTGKPTPNKRAHQAQLRAMREELARQFKGSLSVEELYLLCQRVDSLEFEYPLALLQQAHEYVWERLNEALLVRDHYSIQYLSASGLLIGLDLSFFALRFQQVENRKRKLVHKIQQLFNFSDRELRESAYNYEFDEILKECVRLDLRGLPAYMLLTIRARRDELVNLCVDADTSDVYQVLMPALEKEREKNRSQKRLFGGVDWLEWLLLFEQGIKKHALTQEIASISAVPQVFFQAPPSSINYVHLLEIPFDSLMNYAQFLSQFRAKSERSTQHLQLAKDRIRYITDWEIDLNIYRRLQNDIKLMCLRNVYQHKNFKAHLNTQGYLFPTVHCKRPFRYIYDRYITREDAELRKHLFTIQNCPLIYDRRNFGQEDAHPQRVLFQWPLSTFFCTQQHVPEVQNDYQIIRTHLSELFQNAEYGRHDNLEDDLESFRVALMSEANYPRQVCDELFLAFYEQVFYLLSGEYDGHSQPMTLLVANTLYFPPSRELCDYFLIMLENMGKQDDVLALQKILYNHLQEDFQYPDWSPSSVELHQRMREQTYSGTLQVNICDAARSGFTYRVRFPEHETFAELLTRFCDQIGFLDKGSVWLYALYGQENIAVRPDDNIMEYLGQVYDSLSLRQRIQSPYTIFHRETLKPAQLRFILGELLFFIPEVERLQHRLLQVRLALASRNQVQQLGGQQQQLQQQQQQQYQQQQSMAASQEEDVYSSKMHPFSESQLSRAQSGIPPISRLISSEEADLRRVQSQVPKSDQFLNMQDQISESGFTSDMRKGTHIPLRSELTQNSEQQKQAEVAIDLSGGDFYYKTVHDIIHAQKLIPQSENSESSISIQQKKYNSQYTNKQMPDENNLSYLTSDDTSNYKPYKRNLIDNLLVGQMSRQQEQEQEQDEIIQQNEDNMPLGPLKAVKTPATERAEQAVLKNYLSKEEIYQLRNFSRQSVCYGCNIFAGNVIEDLTFIQVVPTPFFIFWCDQNARIGQIFFDEVLRIHARNQTDLCIVYYNKDNDLAFEFNVRFKAPRATEFVEDVISYMTIALYENTLSLYSYTQLFRLKERHKIARYALDIDQVFNEEKIKYFAIDLECENGQLVNNFNKEKIEFLSRHLQYTQPIIFGDSIYPQFRESQFYTYELPRGYLYDENDEHTPIINAARHLKQPTTEQLQIILMNEIEELQNRELPPDVYVGVPYTQKYTPTEVTSESFEKETNFKNDFNPQELQKKFGQVQVNNLFQIYFQSQLEDLRRASQNDDEGGFQLHFKPDSLQKYGFQQANDESDNTSVDFSLLQQMQSPQNGPQANLFVSNNLLNAQTLKMNQSDRAQQPGSANSTTQNTAHWQNSIDTPNYVNSAHSKKIAATQDQGQQQYSQSSLEQGFVYNSAMGRRGNQEANEWQAENKSQPVPELQDVMKAHQIRENYKPPNDRVIIEESKDFQDSMDIYGSHQSSEHLPKPETKPKPPSKQKKLTSSLRSEINALINEGQQNSIKQQHQQKAAADAAGIAQVTGQVVQNQQQSQQQIQNLQKSEQQQNLQSNQQLPQNYQSQVYQSQQKNQSQLKNDQVAQNPYQSQLQNDQVAQNPYQSQLKKDLQQAVPNPSQQQLKNDVQQAVSNPSQQQLKNDLQQAVSNTQQQKNQQQSTIQNLSQQQNLQQPTISNQIQQQNLQQQSTISNQIQQQNLQQQPTTSNPVQQQSSQQSEIPNLTQSQNQLKGDQLIINQMQQNQQKQGSNNNAQGQIAEQKSQIQSAVQDPNFKLVPGSQLQQKIDQKKGKTDTVVTDKYDSASRKGASTEAIAIKNGTLQQQQQVISGQLPPQQDARNVSEQNKTGAEFQLQQGLADTTNKNSQQQYNSNKNRAENQPNQISRGVNQVQQQSTASNQLNKQGLSTAQNFVATNDQRSQAQQQSAISAASNKISEAQKASSNATNLQQGIADTSFQQAAQNSDRRQSQQSSSAQQQQSLNQTNSQGLAQGLARPERIDEQKPAAMAADAQKKTFTSPTTDQQQQQQQQQQQEQQQQQQQQQQAGEAELKKLDEIRQRRRTPPKDKFFQPSTSKKASRDVSEQQSHNSIVEEHQQQIKQAAVQSKVPPLNTSGLSPPLGASQQIHREESIDIKSRQDSDSVLSTERRNQITKIPQFSKGKKNTVKEKKF